MVPLYQYFPNKNALLQAVLRRHVDEVTAKIEAVCQKQTGQPLQQRAAALITAFLAAKMRNVEASAALYSVSGDVDGAKIARQMGIRSNKAVAGMLASAPEQLTTDTRVMASLLVGSMFGVSRRMLESGSPEKQLDTVRRQVIALAGAYLNACSVSRAQTAH